MVTDTVLPHFTCFLSTAVRFFPLHSVANEVHGFSEPVREKGKRKVVPGELIKKELFLVISMANIIML